MALQIKCDLYLNDNEIVIYDSTGFYGSSNVTGWSTATMNGGSPLTATIVDDTLTPNIESITLIIDGTTIVIESGSNESILPVSLDYVTSPGDLIFTINQYTYPSFYTEFAEFTDGVHTVSYTIAFTSGSGYGTISYSGEFFTYKEVESQMWDLFHTIAYNHNNGGNNQQYINKALYALSLFKGLEYSARTSTSNTKSLEILGTVSKVLDFNNSLSC